MKHHVFYLRTSNGRHSTSPTVSHLNQDGTLEINIGRIYYPFYETCCDVGNMLSCGLEYSERLCTSIATMHGVRMTLSRYNIRETTLFWRWRWVIRMRVTLLRNKFNWGIIIHQIMFIIMLKSKINLNHDSKSFIWVTLKVR